MDLQELKEKQEAPEWLTDEGLTTLQNGYLLSGETPKDMWRRVCKSAAERLKKPELEDKFFQLFWNNWLCGATPVLSNMGTDRGLPISCNSLHVGDSVRSIFNKQTELALLSKNGAGVGIYIGDIRGRGSNISGNGKSEGVIPWLKCYDSTTVAVSQGCYDDKTEILTEKGWVKFKNLKSLGKVKVAQVSNKQIDFVDYSDYIEYHTNENLYWFHNESLSLDMLVTGNHNMVVERRKRVSNKRNSQNKFVSHQKKFADKLELVSADSIKLHRDNKFWTSFPTSNKSSDSLTALEKLAIAYQADGATNPSGNSNGSLSGEVMYNFHFSKQRKINKLIDILNDAKYRYTFSNQKDGTTNISVRYPISSLPSKKFTDTFELSKFSDLTAKQFIQEIGCWDGFSGDSFVSYFSTDEDNVDFVQSVATLAGFMTSKVKASRHGRKDLYRLYVSTNCNYVGCETVKKEKVPYNGKVYCVTVPSNIIVVRRNGRTLVCGNSVRRGASAVYLPVDHPDIEEFINVRRPVGDVNRRCLNLHHAVCINDKFMEGVKNGGEHERHLWKEILKARFETGEPYLFFNDNVDRQKPECYVKNNLDIKTSNICVTGDQRVVTSKGLKTAYDLYKSKEDLILFDGKKEVKASKMHLIEKDAKVFRITTKEGRTHSITEYHKVLTNKGLVECKDLKVGDKVSIQRTEGLFGSIHEPEMAFLLGMYHGDGTQTEDKVFIDVWEHDFKLKNEIENCIQKVYEKNNWMTYKFNSGGSNQISRKTTIPKFINQKSNTSSVSKIRLGSSKLKQFGFRKNTIPDWIWEGDKETQAQYLRGLFITDGCAGIYNSKNSFGKPLYLSLASISLDLLRNVQIILSNLGINSKIYNLLKERVTSLPNGKGSYSDYKCKQAWRLNINDKNSALKFEKLTGFLSYKGVDLEDREYRDNTKKYDSITLIEQIENQDVYCTTVESNEHVWTCNSFITSNCNEIYLYTDPDHTFVCCLSSMNLFKYDEWKNTNAVQLSIWFLDAVMQEYIDKAKDISGFESAVRFAEKSRALGLGVLGWHSLLQKNKVPFDSFEAMRLNAEIFKHMQKESQIATRNLAKEYGEPEWCKGFGIRNSHQMAVAPTVSNSIISGSVSAGIEPISANVIALKTGKGTFMRSNPILKELLAEKGMDNIDVWKQINENSGSVSELKFLTDKEKEIFLTAREINQHAIIKQAGQRQKYIDQGQSTNLFFAKNSDPKYIHSVHMLAWEEGLKGLYYCRSEAALKGDSVNRQKEECKACEG